MRRVRYDASTRVPLLDSDPDGPVVEALPRRENAPRASCVELCAATAFSFLTGASQPEEMVHMAVRHGADCLGIADAHGVYGLARAHSEAQRLNARIVVGVTLQIEFPDGRPGPVVVLHPVTRPAYARFCRLITRGHHGRAKGTCRVSLEDVCSSGPDMFCTVMPPFLDCAVDDETGFSVADDDVEVLAPAHDRTLRTLKEAFGPMLNIALVRRMGAEDEFYDRWAREAEQALDAHLLPTTRPLMHGTWRKPAQDVLQCIRLGVRIYEAGTLLLPNAEARLLSPLEMEGRFSDVPDALNWTREMADICDFSLSSLKYRFPSDRLMPGESALSRLRALTFEGARRRYGGVVPDAVTKQLLHELTLIEKIDVAPYFLTVHDIVETARARHILCQGRGSAANSAVCYVLGITSVDPVRMQLLFERFLSEERNEPPDIDVDFEHERREEVIQDIYKRWGREHAGMVCEVICYRGKSALREAGKVVGLDGDTLDRLSNLMVHSALGDVLDARMKEVGVSPSSPEVRLCMFISRALQGYPRHIGVHVGGFVLTEDPLVDSVPIEPAAMENRTVIQWDKDDLDVVGMFKMDVLGLGMLTALRKTMDMVRQAGGPSHELWTIPAEDPPTYAAIQKADTVGVFQIESRAQMAMLPRLKPVNFYDLVIEVAIVRPGPIQGDMVHPYLRRRRGEEKIEYPHPRLIPVLERTLGVPLFQEQVMKLAILGAGYTGGEADQLRRDMAAWKKNGRLARHQQKLIDGFAKNGISREFADRLYAQILGFGEYGFPESHAASFALLTYASSYLKVHHPAAFAAALINSQPMGFYSPSSIIQDAQRHGVKVLPVDALYSTWDCTLERQPDGTLALRLGFRLIKGMNQERIEQLVLKRDTEGAVSSLEDVMGAAQWRPHEVHALSGSGALRSVSEGRREALWDAVGVETDVSKTNPEPRLTTGLPTQDDAPSLPGLSPMELMLKDYAHTGLSVDDHPMKHLRPLLNKRRVLACGQLSTCAHGSVVKVAGLAVTRQRPGTASGVTFITIEDETGTANIVVWIKVFEKFYRVARNAPIIEVRGKLERDGDVIHVIAQHLGELALPRSGFQVKSRDFH